MEHKPAKQLRGSRAAEMRGRLALRDGPRCVYCSTEFDPWDTTAVHIDHRQPRSLGGTNDIENLALACATCNMRKAAKPVVVYIAEYTARLHQPRNIYMVDVAGWTSHELAVHHFRTTVMSYLCTARN